MAAKQNVSQENSTDVDVLYRKVTTYIDQARQAVRRTVDTHMVQAYWLCGRAIVEHEQKGQARANYRSFLIKELSARLTNLYGRGFSSTSLKEMRKFYIVYHGDKAVTRKGHPAGDLFAPRFSSSLSWRHYRALMKLVRKEARQFYEKEAIANCWSGRELERQIGSLLFERLAKSKDKDGLLKLAREGQEIIKPTDAFKEPIILEFLGLPESHKLVESNLESALIENLQHFLLELGKGFSFVARQKRLTIDGDHYYADLVFYHVILKCYVIIDLKTQPLSHSDLGQIQLYVNYFDQEIKQDNDNPTIGLVLCTQRKDEMAKYLLGDQAKQIFTSSYRLHLPTEKELEAELMREMELIKDQWGGG